MFARRGEHFRFCTEAISSSCKPGFLCSPSEGNKRPPYTGATQRGPAGKSPRAAAERWHPVAVPRGKVSPAVGRPESLGSPVLLQDAECHLPGAPPCPGSPLPPTAMASRDPGRPQPTGGCAAPLLPVIASVFRGSHWGEVKHRAEAGGHT